MPETIRKWWTAGFAMHFDRVVSEELLDALRPGRQLHGAVTWCKQDPALRDFQLRKEPKGPASWATLYVGLTSLLDIYERGGRFRLEAHGTHKEAGGFDPAWSSWQCLEVLNAAWPKVISYLDRAALKVQPRWTDSEGRVHAMLSTSANTEVSVINREASISFCNQPKKTELCDGWTTSVIAALVSCN